MCLCSSRGCLNTQEQTVFAWSIYYWENKLGRMFSGCIASFLLVFISCFFFCVCVCSSVFFFFANKYHRYSAHCDLYKRCMAEIESDVPISCTQTIHWISLKIQKEITELWALQFHWSIYQNSSSSASAQCFSSAVQPTNQHQVV